MSGISSALISTIGKSVTRVFPLLAIILCGAMFLFMEGNYEQHYDSQWHQNSIESVMRWNEFSLDLGGNPLHNFGIQHVINPQLSPTFWIGNIVPQDHRIQVQAAFQAIVFFVVFLQICGLSGARLCDASAISLIAVYFFWVPILSAEAITLNATLGLLWQEGAIAALLAFFCFAQIGFKNSKNKPKAWPVIGLASTILWLYVAYPELSPLFTLATTGLCLGALLGAESKKELRDKCLSSFVIIMALLVIGLPNYVLNLFLYTPQMYYDTLYVRDFEALFFSNTSLLLASDRLGGAKVVGFFVLAAIGAFVALRFGKRFARRVVFAGLALEVTIHLLSTVNLLFELVPMTFTYVEQMGLSVVALLAGAGVWGTLRLTFLVIGGLYNSTRSSGWRTSDLFSPTLRSSTVQSLPYVVLICLGAMVLYQLSRQTNFYSGWPPRTDSEPAQIQARELAIRPGENFKGRGAVLLEMNNEGPISWGPQFFPILYYKYRVALGNDLMNDAEAAGIPIVNEYGHWISPPMLALLTAAFYRPEDRIDRAAQAPRVFRPNLARLLGVSLVVSDKPLDGQVELYHGIALDHPLYIYRVPGANLGQYSPTNTVVASSAEQILDHLQAVDFDGKELAVIEQPLGLDLVQAEAASVSLLKGPRIRVEAYSEGTSLIVLPFDYSHCLKVEGEGLDRMVPVNLAQTGLVVHGEVSVDISYRYGLLKGTSCRKQDLERVQDLQLAEAATGRLFYDARQLTTSPNP